MERNMKQWVGELIASPDRAALPIMTHSGIELIGHSVRDAVTDGENGVTLDDILVHDAHEKDTMVHVMLASMKYPDFPVALGIIRDVAEPTYEREVARQIAEVQATAKIKNVDDLLNSGETWEVE